MSAQRIDQFEVLEELGRGGMGAVYRARDLHSGRHVALKVVLDQQTRPERLARLEREGKLTAALDHPGILKIHGAGVWDGLPYLAYEVVEGCRTLEEVFTSGGETLRERVGLVRDAAEALGAAHRKGIIHRDVKPENLLVDREGRIKVADFGLATAQDLDRLTKTGALLGTPSFMAPEQIDTRAGAVVGAGADVWALGAVLYLGLTGELPFQGATFFELAAQINSGRPRRPSQLAAEVSLDLEAVCLRALEKESGDRYPDGAAFAADLDRALRGESVEASRHSELRVLARRSRWLALPAVALLTAALVASFYQPEVALPPPVAGPPPVAEPPPAETVAAEGGGGTEPAAEPAAESLFTPQNPAQEVLRQALDEGLDTLVAGQLQGEGDRALYLTQRGRALRRLNPKEAYKNLREAGELGSGEACRIYAEAHYSGEFGFTKNLPEALAWFRRGAEAGDPECSYRVGLMICRGEGAAADMRAGIQWLLRAAEHGFGNAMPYVAQEFLRGRHLPKDMEEFRFWREKAREKGAWTPGDDERFRLE